jgi:hypothetical protein
MKYLKHLTIILLATATFSSASAQFGVPNLLKYDKKVFHFGFLIGYNQSDFIIYSHAQLNDQDTLNVINTRGYSGFNLGIVTDLRMGKYFDLRFIPTLSFIDRSVIYNNNSSLEYHQNTNPKNNVAGAVYMDLPLMVKLKSSRMLNNVRAYVLAGAQYSLDLTSIAKKRQNNVGYVLRLHPHDFQGIAGVGFDFYCTYFKFAAELKMAFGVRNLLVTDPDIHATTINSLKSKVLMISFTFE